MGVNLKKDETGGFAWIVWRDSPTRDAGMAKLMSDPRVQPDVNPMPFDGQRMIFGGFEMIVKA